MAFQIHSANPNSLQAPDIVELVPLSGIDPEYVISRNKEGKVLSRFKDNKWDCRIYGAKTTFNFGTRFDTKTGEQSEALARVLREEIKTILWLCLFETTANAERSRGMTYVSQVTTLLHALAKVAFSLHIPLAKAHTSAQFQVAVRSSIASVKPGFSLQTALIGILKDLAYWQEVQTIKCNVPRLVPESDLSDLLLLLKKKRDETVDQREQHPLIPTRLFSKIIGGALDQLKEAEHYLPRLEAYIKAVHADPTLCVDEREDYRKNVSRVRKIYPDQTFPTKSDAKRQFVSTDEVLERFGLTTYAEKVGFKNLPSIDSLITRLHVLCALLIHAFSGMRTSEVQVIPFEPTVNSTAKGFGELPVLVSHLQKFTRRGNYSSPLVWATSEEGLYAVGIAQQLSRLKWFRRNPSKDSLPSNIPLFVGTDINITAPRIHYSVPIATTPFSSMFWRSACQSLGLVIEAEDLDELRVFDAFREWDENPNFAVGKLWPLSSHQFRRSVAVYASRSGMVSLPTLKTQYKHLSEVMTALYSENSTYAQNFLIDESGKSIDDGSVLMHFRDAIAFNTSVRFHEQVIQSERKLSGAIGAEIQRAKDNGTLPKMFLNREETKKAVTQGRLSYKETSVGGCMLKGSCPHFAVDLVLPCTSGCKHAILNPEKLKTYVESLRFDLQLLSPKSRPYQFIAKEIDFVTSTYLESAKNER